MRIEVKHNPEYFKLESMLKWKMTWKEQMERHILFLVLGIILFMTSILMIKDSFGPGYIFLSLSLAWGIISANFLIHAGKSKRKYLKLIEQQSEKYVQNGSLIMFEFEEEYFGYKDFQYEMKINWPTFSGVQVVDKTLLMMLHNKPEQSLSLSEGEVGEEKFKEIAEFVKKKVNR